jgi:putative ABC transport system permease protein
MGPEQRDKDLQREIAAHLALEASEREDAGASPEAARLAALRAFGNTTLVREEARSVWIQAWVQDAIQDLRYAGRVFARTPVFTLGAVLILALGIGASTAIFGAIKAVILAPLPYADPDRLVRVWQTNPSRNVDQFSVSLPLYRDWRSNSRSWTDMAALRNGSVTVQTTTGGPEQVPAQFISANTLALLGQQPARGRAFLPEEDAANAEAVVILSDGFWRRVYAASPDVIGRSLTIEGRAHTVVGVASAATLGDRDAQVLLPVTPYDEDRRGLSTLDVYGRLRSGVTLAAATEEMTALATRLADRYPEDHTGWSVRLVPLSEVVVGAGIRQRLYLLLAAVGTLLLIACANLSGLLLVRACARSREMAIRAAIGGGRGRIVRQLLAESLLLAALGGAAGVGVAYAGLHVLRSTAMADVPRASSIGLDPWVVLFALAISTAAGVVAGLAPARQMARLDIQRGLHDRSPAATGTSRLSRNVLVVAQLSLSIVLLAASGLMLRTLDWLNRTDLGFVPDRIVTAQVAPRTNPEAFFATLVARVQQLPGVVGAGATSGAPMTSGNTSLNVYAVGASLVAPTASVQSDWRSVSAGYFGAMQISLLAGRDFTPRDDGEAPKVVVVNETLARGLWGNESPIGRQLDLGGGGGEPATIIGLVRDVRSQNPAEPARPTYYVSAYRGVWGPMTLVIRTSDAAETLLPLVRSEVRALDPLLPVFGVRTMTDLVAAQLAPQRLVAGLLSGFAALALLLAIVGIYGVMAYSTSQRTLEVGIRIALGAERRDVLRALVRDGTLLIAAGAALGLLMALPAMQLLRGLLTGVSPFDPLTFLVTTLLLVVSALAACYLPARRASRVDPLRALRGE